ncbi:MAG: hypothetical protein ACOYXC_00965, partial [Candidatus Rifleibacteriota bacterium]
MLLVTLLSVAGSLFASIRPEGSLMPVPVLEREECNTDTPFGQYREKSSQRFIYTRKTSHLVTEINYRHVLFKDYLGTAPEKNYLYQASFKGYNLSSPLEFKAGRIGAGNNKLQTIDGVSWYYPWGNRLYTTVDLGRVAPIDDEQKDNPSFAEARFHYRFNEQAFMAIKGVNQYDDSFGSAMLGYNGEDLRVTGEYLGGSATDTLHLSMQYLSPKKFDWTSDYLIYHNSTSDSGTMRHYLGLETGSFYIESGIGNRFWFNGPNTPDSWFYEGTLTWGNRSSDNITAGYLVESTPASASRTIYAHAERKVSKKTTLSLGVEDTTFEKGEGSVQNLEGGIRRRVQWGHVELRGAVISGGSDSDLQKDVRLKAAY